MSGSSFRRPLAGGLLAATLTGGTILAGTASAIAVEVESTPPPVQMRIFDPADFSTQAAHLPVGLVEAVERDLGLSATEYLAEAAAAEVAGDILVYLGDVVRSAWLDGQVLHVALSDRAAVATARATGVAVQVGDALADALDAARRQGKLAYVDRRAGKVVLVELGPAGWPVATGEMTTRTDLTSWESGSEALQPLAVYDSAPAVTGAPACFAGPDSGWECGRLLEAAAAIPAAGDVVTGFIFDACSLPGDGGAPIVMGNYALGVNSTWAEAACLGDVRGGISFGYPIPHREMAILPSQHASPFSVRPWALPIHVGTPVVDSPVQDGTTGPTPTFSGHVTAAAGSIVTVVVDNGAPRQATVNPSGEWQVTVTQPLSSGSHTYRVTASHVARTAAIATTSGSLEGSFEVTEVANLEVATPVPGENLAIVRPRFEGTGHPGATVTLTIDGHQSASAMVGRDSGWRLSPPADLRAGRFDATLTQQWGTSSSSVAVPSVGITPGAPTIASPRPGESVGPAHTFTGTGIPGATISITVRAAGEEPVPSGSHTVQVRADVHGSWEIDLDAALPAGEHKIVAVQSVDDLQSTPSATVSFDVAGRRPGHDDDTEAAGDESLARTSGPVSRYLLAAAGMLVIGLVVSTGLRARLRVSR